jgi:hypothetical protein
LTTYGVVAICAEIRGERWNVIGLQEFRVIFRLLREQNSMSYTPDGYEHQWDDEYIRGAVEWETVFYTVLVPC